MTGATCKITHQNPDGEFGLRETFGIKDSEEGGYWEVFLGKDGCTGQIYLGIKGNRYALFAKLDDVAKKTLLAYLTAVK